MTENIPKGTEKKIMELQLLEQNLQNSLMQKQRFQTELLETENALKEVASTKEAYKIVGNIMVASKKEDLKKELSEKKKIIDLRMKTLEKEESQLKEKTNNLQKQVIGEMKK
jgi:prefoldin beta subunit